MANRIRIDSVSVAGMISMSLLLICASATAQTFKVISLESLGCASGVFAVNVERAGLDGGQYDVRTQVLIDGLHYMNERASISLNGASQWALFDNYTYGPIPNPGVWPMPSHQTLSIRFTLERPIGWPLHDWLLIVRSCNLGGVEYNGPTHDLIFRGDFQ